MFTEQRSSSATITAPAANTIVKTDLIRRVRTLMLGARIRGTVTLAGGPATAILNGGSIACAFDYAGTDENGFQPIKADPRLLIAAHQMLAARDTDHGRVRLTNTANGAYNLEESVFLPFTNVQSAGPNEAPYMERNPQQAFSFFVQQRSTDLLNRIVQSPGTAVLSAVSVTVGQRYDLQRDHKGFFVPIIRHLAEVVVAGTQPNFIVKLESTNYLQGLIIQQDTSGAGEVTDIINSLAIRADGRDFVGPQQRPYEEMQAEAQLEFSGDCVSRGYLPVWFRPGGRLANIVNTNQYANLRLEASVQASVTAGAGTSVIRVLSLELVAVPGLTNPPNFNV